MSVGTTAADAPLPKAWYTADPSRAGRQDGLDGRTAEPKRWIKLSAGSSTWGGGAILPPGKGADGGSLPCSWTRAAEKKEIAAMRTGKRWGRDGMDDKPGLTKEQVRLDGGG